MGITTCGLGLTTYINSSNMFVFIAIVLRFFQGQGDILL
jgi:hypothetical protein